MSVYKNLLSVILIMKYKSINLAIKIHIVEQLSVNSSDQTLIIHDNQDYLTSFVN